MRNISLLALACGWAVFMPLSGCELLSPEKEETGSPAGVLVVNQGNFSDGNGSVMVHDPASGTVGRLEVDFGSILQSAAVMDGRLFVAANSADRVDVFEVGTWQRLAGIDGILSPRYFAQVDADKAYVTNLFKSGYSGGSVTVLDLTQLAVTGQVDVGDNPEGMAVHQGVVYVANHGFGWGNSLSVLDIETDTVVRTMVLDCEGPRSVFVDDEDEIWIFCTGRPLYDEEFNESGHTDGRVLVLRAAGDEVVRFDVAGGLRTMGPGQDVTFSAKTGLAFAAGTTEIHVFDTATNSRSQPLALPSGASVGAVAYDREEDRIYIGHVQGFLSAGFVTVHDRSGAEVRRFGAGVAPTWITFLR